MPLQNHQEIYALIEPPAGALSEAFADPGPGKRCPGGSPVQPSPGRPSGWRDAVAVLHPQLPILAARAAGESHRLQHCWLPRARIRDCPPGLVGCRYPPGPLAPN